jgi:hypothetical protein
MYILPTFGNILQYSEFDALAARKQNIPVVSRYNNGKLEHFTEITSDEIRELFIPQEYDLLETLGQYGYNYYSYPHDGIYDLEQFELIIKASIMRIAIRNRIPFPVYSFYNYSHYDVK